MFSFDTASFLAHGTPQLMFSGEFHYFRVPEEDWAKRLELWRAAGGNMVATYIPWSIHEPEEGTFVDLDKLRRFLETVSASGLFLTVRPGPYVYSELLNDGLPSWLMEKYPEVKAVNKAGRAFRHSSISYMNPVFMEKAEKYLRTVCPIVAEFTQAKGGPVAVCQADNELYGIHTWFGTLDYNPATFGFGQPNGRYAQFLKRRFGSVQAVNERYGVNHSDWAEFSLADEPASGIRNYHWNRDYQDCYVEQGADYLERLVAIMKDCGIDCKFCHNSGNSNMNALFRTIKSRLKDEFLVGSDHYFNLNQNWGQNNPTPQYFVTIFTSLEELRLMGNPSSVLEMPFGSMSDWPPLVAEDMEACLRLHLAAGMKGLNGYILTGGPNVPGTGVTTDIYDYSAPIGARNEIRPTFHVLERFGELLKKYPGLPAARPAVDFQVWASQEGLTAAALPQWLDPQLPGALQPAEIWNFLRQGLLTTAFAGGLQPRMTTLENADVSKPLVLACLGAMSANEQQQAVDFIRRGGKVLCMPMLPRYDDDFGPCTILADFLDASCEEYVDTSVYQPRCSIEGVPNVNCNKGTAFAAKIPAQAEIIGVDAASGKVVAWTKKYGNGAFAYLGFHWFYTNYEQHIALTRLLKRLGMVPCLQNNNPWMLTLLRGNLLFLCNLTTGTANLEVTLNESGRRISKTVPPMTVDIVEL